MIFKQIRLYKRIHRISDILLDTSICPNFYSPTFRYQSHIHWPQLNIPRSWHPSWHKVVNLLISRILHYIPLSIPPISLELSSRHIRDHIKNPLEQRLTLQFIFSPATIDQIRFSLVHDALSISTDGTFDNGICGGAISIGSKPHLIEFLDFQMMASSMKTSKEKL